MLETRATRRRGLKLDEFLRLNAPEDLGALTAAVAKASITVWDGIPFGRGSSRR